MSRPRSGLWFIAPGATGPRRAANIPPRWNALERRHDKEAQTLSGAQGPSLQLYLIRHGETEWSLSGQHTGRTEIALTARGEEGARELAPYLTGIPFARVLTSPRQRARQTCELAGLGGAAEIEPDLAGGG